MKPVELGSVCDINPACPENLLQEMACSFVPMEAVDDAFGVISHLETRQISEVKTGYSYFSDGDVIFAKITPCMENGKAAIARNLKNGIGFGSTEFHTLRPHKGVSPEWIFHFLRQEETRQRAAHRMTGSAGQKRVPVRVLEELLIPIPSPAEQEKILEHIEKADRLRRMRRYALELTDDFLRANFAQMFGKALATATSLLGDLVTITGGGTPSRDTPAFYSGKIPWLTSKDMRGDYIWDTEEHVTQEAIDQSATKLVPAGSVLLVVKSKILMHRLPLAIAKVPLCHGQDIKSIQCSDRLLPEFVRYLLEYHAPALLHVARGANTEGLTLPMLEELRVPDASMKAQEHFSRIVQRTERIKERQREAERQAEHLFQTLLHQAFSTGEREAVPA